jgi:hypothetical protein
MLLKGKLEFDRGKERVMDCGHHKEIEEHIVKPMESSRMPQASAQNLVGPYLSKWIPFTFRRERTAQSKVSQDRLVGIMAVDRHRTASMSSRCHYRHLDGYQFG